MLIRTLGTVPYQPTYEAMQAFTAQRTEGAPDELWLCEHPPVFTLGLAGAPHGVSFDAALMKGLSNYVCRRRLGEALGSDGPLGADPRLDAVRRWAMTSQSGDRAELGLEGDAPGAAWSRVASSSDTRIGSQCAHYEECFVTRMKRAAERASIVVVNHHLYCADLALRQSRAGEYGAGVLPPHDAVIFDEAHQIEDVATDFFGLRVSTSKIDALARDAERALVMAGRSGDPRARRTLEQVEALSRTFFSALTARAASATRRSIPYSKYRGSAADRARFCHRSSPNPRLHSP